MTDKKDVLSLFANKTSADRFRAVIQVWDQSNTLTGIHVKYITGTPAPPTDLKLCACVLKNNCPICRVQV